jgi:hypothetical protein
MNFLDYVTRRVWFTILTPYFLRPGRRPFRMTLYSFGRGLGRIVRRLRRADKR